MSESSKSPKPKKGNDSSRPSSGHATRSRSRDGIGSTEAKSATVIPASTPHAKLQPISPGASDADASSAVKLKQPEKNASAPKDRISPQSGSDSKSVSKESTGIAEERRAKILFRLQVCLVLSLLFHAALLFYFKNQIIQCVWETPRKFDREQLMELMDLPQVEERIVPVYNSAQLENPTRVEEFEKIQPMVSATELEGVENSELPDPSELSAKIDHEFQKRDMPDLQDTNALTPVDAQALAAPSEQVTPDLSRSFNVEPSVNSATDVIPTEEIQTSAPEMSLADAASDNGQLGQNRTPEPVSALVLKPDIKDLVRPTSTPQTINETDLSWTNPLRTQSLELLTSTADAPSPLSRPTPMGRPKPLSSPEDPSMYIASAARLDVSRSRRTATEGASGAPRRAYDPQLDSVSTAVSSVSGSFRNETSRQMDHTMPGVPLDQMIQLRNTSADIQQPHDDLASLRSPMNATRRYQPNPTQAYQGRDPQLRVETISRFGGSPATSQAIDRGVKYISSTQWPDGRWTFHVQPDSFNVPQRAQQNGSIHCDTGATALGLLAMMGAGYTHLEGPYKDNIYNALNYLLIQQANNIQAQKEGKFGVPGALFNRDSDTDDNSLSYAHAMATVALCEAYGMTRDERLRSAAQEAIRYIRGTQNQLRGGWRYENPDALGMPHRESDTSSSGWQLMALKSAMAAEVADTSASIFKARDWLKQARNPEDGLYTYNPFNGPSEQYTNWRTTTPAMTAEGAFMQWCIGTDLADLSNCVEYIRQNPPQTHSASQLKRDVYYWYYATTVMFAYQGPEWREWQKQIMPMLMECQVKDETSLSGSWDPSNPAQDRWGHIGGRHYITCMSMMILEIYARHLPLYQNMSKRGQ